MKVKTNVRAGQGGSTSTDSTDTSASTSTSNKKQNGKTAPVYYPVVSRCVGI